MPGQQMSAGYLSLTNNTGEAISISRVVSPQFEAVEMHESLLENGVAKMRRIPQLTVPPNSTVSLERGGKHLMLKREVVEACREGRFHVHSVAHVDQGIAILTGREAGTRGEDGAFPEGSVNRLVEDRLVGFAAARRRFGKGATSGDV